jgi:hypothetical protein
MGCTLGDHADVASAVVELKSGVEKKALPWATLFAMRKLSSARMFEDGELSVTLRMQNTSHFRRFWKFVIVFLK